MAFLTFKPSKLVAIAGWLSLLVGLIILFFGFKYFDQFTLEEMFKELYINVSFTLFGIAGTVLIIDKLNQIKFDAISIGGYLRDMSSHEKSIAIRGVQELRRLGKISNGFLSRQEFSGANLEEAQLMGLASTGSSFIGCKFEKADLANSFLEKSIFNGANLTKANLERARLQSSTFLDASLTNADLTNADLRKADLSSANLTGADLRNADLRGAVLVNAIFLNAKLGGAKVGNATFDITTDFGDLVLPECFEENGLFTFPEGSEL